MALHHKSKRYEVQQRHEQTLSWRPVYHTDDQDDATNKVRDLIQRHSDRVYRVLDRKDGANKAKPLEV